MRRFFLMALVPAALLLTAACGGGDSDSDGGSTPSPDSGAAATEAAGRAAQRPEWFPARFPLPAESTVVRDEPAAAGGGTVEFDAPLGFSRVINIMQLNLESPSHRFLIVEHSADENEALFVIDDQDGEFTGEVTLRPAGNRTAIIVELAPK